MTRYQFGSISGTVMESGTPVPNAKVMAFDRNSGLCIAIVRSNTSGAFTMPSLFDTTDASYFVVALDPDGGVIYNALIYDRIQAV
jgi:hypothetical protein